MANQSSSGVRQNVPLPVVIGAIVVVLVIAGVFAYRSLSNTTPANETSAIKQMSIPDQIKHYNEVRAHDMEARKKANAAEAPESGGTPAPERH